MKLNIPVEVEKTSESVQRRPVSRVRLANTGPLHSLETSASSLAIAKHVFIQKCQDRLTKPITNIVVRAKNGTILAGSFVPGYGGSYQIFHMDGAGGTTVTNDTDANGLLKSMQDHANNCYDGIANTMKWEV